MTHPATLATKNYIPFPSPLSNSFYFCNPVISKLEGQKILQHVCTTSSRETQIIWKLAYISALEHYCLCLFIHYDN
jgi:hypothetical protein